MIGIYKITSPTNKVYIGQSVDIEKRKKSYFAMHSRNNQQVRLYKSFLKHGVKNHIFEVIEECFIESLNERERFYQDLYNVIESGLNCRLTTTNDKSGKLSVETKEKLKGKECSLETRKKISLKNKGTRIGNKNTFYGKKHTNETKLKISLANKGKLLGEKNPNFGKIRSKEIRNKISLANKGNKSSLNRILSDETKNKIANSLFKKVINIKTLEVFNSYKELALLLKISHNTLNKKLNGNINNNTDYRYL